MSIARRAALTAVLAVGVATSVIAADLELGGAAGADVVSAYIFRGATVNKEWNVQPYIEVASDTYGVTLGTWANYNTDPSQFDEIDYYISWDVPVAEDQPWGLSLGYTEYTYPTGVDANGLGLEADREINLGVGVDTLLQPELFVAFGVDGPFLKDGIHLALSGSHDYAINDKSSVSGGATLGFELGDNVVDTGVSYLQLSLGGAYDILSVSLNYIVETDDKVLKVDEDFYVAFSVAI